MKRIVVGISGASGVILGIRLLEHFRGKVESHLVITKCAEKMIALETRYSMGDVKSLASKAYDQDDFTALIASGTFLTDGMVIIPCSIKSLSGIVSSYNDSLLIRAADVTLKEQRRLVVCIRETPFHLGHLRLMVSLAERGAIICPPIPAYYYNPQSIMELQDHLIGKVMDLFGVEHDLMVRWEDGYAR